MTTSTIPSNIVDACALIGATVEHIGEYVNYEIVFNGETVHITNGRYNRPSHFNMWVTAKRTKDNHIVSCNTTSTNTNFLKTTKPERLAKIIVKFFEDNKKYFEDINNVLEHNNNYLSNKERTTNEILAISPKLTKSSHNDSISYYSDSGYATINVYSNISIELSSLPLETAKKILELLVNSEK